MQVQNQTFIEFTLRTDALATRMGLDLIDLPAVIGISKATLFACRSGKNEITGKTWRLLERAENDVPPPSSHTQDADNECPTDAHNELDDEVAALAEMHAEMGRRLEKLRAKLRARGKARA